ncbi:hypothetical protein Y032_0118g780 [Ancylostoma ceylanicum]|uniref:Uncharacterized protein n=1 Tax=Ancylostoma ceylanicum TaxID=53326 RepID=A0A016TBQ1_9BILA|nr:hypothetical protein Y032_0118g780 [Ancylostoma ceylanicum]
MKAEFGRLTISTSSAPYLSKFNGRNEKKSTRASSFSDIQMFELFPREMFELFPRLLLKKQNYSTFIRSKV